MRYEFGLFIRVGLALALFIVPFYVFQVNIFQSIFEKVTFNVVYKFLELSNASPAIGRYSVRNAIQILGGAATLEVVKYCVTSSAYYLLALFTIITMNVQVWKRVLIFLSGTVLIFLMNIARIVLLTVTLLSNPEAFKAAHAALGMFISTIYVVIVWVLLSVLFKVKTVPFYSDIKFLSKSIR